MNTMNIKNIIKGGKEKMARNLARAKEDIKEQLRDKEPEEKEQLPPKPEQPTEPAPEPHIQLITENAFLINNIMDIQKMLTIMKADLEQLKEKLL